MLYQTLDDVDVARKNVCVRLDLNVPIQDGHILDNTRIQKSIPTLEALIHKGAKIAIMSHLGRPKGQAQKKFSLAPVGEELARVLNKEVLLVRDYHAEPIDQLMKQLGGNQIVLFENLRFHPEEEQNQKDFAAQLMHGMDFYLQDGFGVVHRAHASTVACAEQLPVERRIMGPLLQSEIKALRPMMTADISKSPYVVAIGGAKVSDKIGVILKLLESCNTLLIGGAMAYTFLHYKGFQVGKSKVEAEKLDLVEAVYREATKRKVEIHIPIDHVCATMFSDKAPVEIIDTSAIPTALMGLDIGPKTAQMYAEIISQAKSALWNGPMGVFEWDNFKKGTDTIAQAMASCPGYTVVGGGESVAACRAAGVETAISHISTGGGAALEFLEGRTLPGIKALMQPT
ncbi:MAG: phosphoglycerate kinase [Zetaproteobacteria bacterium]|nr:phosphoglycerate kinase [Zetaproteobacteria bacterium]